MVLGFSDLQADIAADLIRHGINVHIFNQRSIKEIYSMILTLGAMVGCQQQALDWVHENEKKITTIQTQVSSGVKPIVYFEEWYDPIINRYSMGI